MRKYICTVCGYIYDEIAGNPKNNIQEGTLWEDVPTSWVCPLCGGTKNEFEEVKKEKGSHTTSFKNKETNLDTKEVEDIFFQFSNGEFQALFLNLSKGCQKQYLNEASELFKQLANYFEANTDSEEGTIDSLLELLQDDLNFGYSNGTTMATRASDRGSLRALVWGEKVSKILNSIIKRYLKQQDELLKNTQIYVCEICGFIYIGDDVPEVCPVCKVTNKKIAEIVRR